MANLLVRATETVRTEGFVALLTKSVVFLKLRWIVFRSNVDGGYEVTVRGNTARIYPSTMEEAIALRYILENESQFIAEVLAELRTGDVVWDVGANIGIHSCLFGTESTKVVAFEPYPPNVRRLRENIESNGIDAEVLPVALSNRDGKELFSVPEAESPGNQWAGLVPDSVSGTRKSRLRNSDIREMDVRRGDTLIEEGVEPPDVVKIDVEGSAHKVIEGLEEWLRNGMCRLVYVEVHMPDRTERRPSIEDFGKDPDEVERRLSEFGFDTSVIMRREFDFFVKGRK